jgi:hypothetical protein
MYDYDDYADYDTECSYNWLGEYECYEISDMSVYEDYVEADDDYVTLHLDRQRFKDFINNWNEWAEETAEEWDDIKENLKYSIDEAFGGEDLLDDYSNYYDYDYYTAMENDE